MKVLAKRVVWIMDEEGREDTDLELRVFKNECDEYEIRAFFHKRYISDEVFSGYESDLESAIGTMIAEADWHEANPDYIGNTEKFEIRCSA
tara:strand:+ start:421 stop:693 length:273 start_codon:yes stop_codon:yes gene_type:complete